MRKVPPGWPSQSPSTFLPAKSLARPSPPPALDSVQYAAALNEVKALGGRASVVRTPEQSEIAVFWSDFSYTSMPPGHWHLIAETIARTRGNTLAENARLFALISIAQADAGIVCWEAKYRYNLWRPVTAIRRAGEDGNPQRRCRDSGVRARGNTHRARGVQRPAALGGGWNQWICFRRYFGAGR